MLEKLALLKDAAPAIGTIIAALSAVVALTVFGYTRGANRRRATLDMVLKTAVDDAGRERYAKFKQLMERHKSDSDDFDILKLASPNSPFTPEREVLRMQINEYELIALGIRRGIFDEKIYKLWFQNQFIRDYESLADFIATVRQKRPSVFCEYVWLYERWKKAPHPENAPSRWKKAWWAMTGDDARLRGSVSARAD